MICIFCLEDYKEEMFSDEHVFPLSIGGAFVIKNVCVSCNSKLGSHVDVHLVNHQAVVNSCHSNKIENRDGVVRNPFENISLFEGTDEKVKYEFDEKGNPLGLYRIPFVDFNKETGKLIIKLDARDKDKLPALIKKISARNNLPSLSEEELSKNSYENRIEKPTLHQTWFFDTIKFKRGILKIAYELSCYWLGEEYVNDKTGILIREFILDNNLNESTINNYPIIGNIGLIEKNSIGHLINYDSFFHLAYLSKHESRLLIYIRILDSLEGIIEVSNDADNYTFISNKFLAINPITGVISDEIKYKINTNEF